MTRPILRRAALVGVLASLALPAAAQAQPNLFSVMMDDDHLVYRDDNTRDRALIRMRDMGVDVVRVTVLWSVVADKARSTKARDKRFRKLKASNPKAYPMLNWDRYDRLVRAARRLGIRVYFNITGPGPSWGHAKAPASQRSSQKAWRPKAKEFYRFVQAVGKRFGGKYRDENDERVILPKVDIWSIWNEPNQAGWLAPQWSGGQPASPRMYRDLYDHGYRALVSTGHGGDVIMIGETAPLGSGDKSTRAPMAPKTFIRELFCVDDALQAKSGGAGCDFFQKKPSLNATWWAHHPYTKNVSPQQPPSDPNAITMANIGDLPAMLDGIAASTQRVKSGMNILNSEFGFETNPPDPHSGVSFDLQARWNLIGELQSFLNPRVVGTSQFLLYDVPPRRGNTAGSKAYWSTYQSGLFTAGGTAKPAYTSYVLPFLVVPSGATDPNSGRPVLTVWGGLRFRPEGAADTFQLQFKPADGSSDWVPLQDVATNQPFQPDPAQPAVGVVEGYFYLPAITTPGPGKVRARWEGPQPPYNFTSMEYDVP